MGRNRIESVINTYAIPIIIVLVVYSILRMLLPAPVMLNDESLIRSVVSGDMTGISDAHLVYSLYPLGLILKGLYNINSDIQWYDLLLLSSHIISWTLITLWISGHSKKMLWRFVVSVITALILASIDIKFVLADYYTVDAALLAAAGMLWIFPTGEGRNKGIFDTVFSVIPLTLALWIRCQVFLMVLPLIILSYVYAFFFIKEKRSLSNLIIMAVMFLLSVFCDKLAYTSDEWKEYVRFNSAIEGIYDYYGTPSYEYSEDVYKSLGYTRTEFDALRAVRFGLISDLDADKLQTLSDYSHDLFWRVSGGFVPQLKMSLSAVKKTILLFPKCSIGIAVISTLIMTLLLLCSQGIIKKEIISPIMMVLGIGYAIAFMWMFSFLRRFPERVSYGLYFALAIYLIGIFFTVYERTREKTGLVSRLIYMSVVFIYAVWYCVIASQYNVEMINLTAEYEVYSNENMLVSQYCEKNNSNVYFLDTSVILSQISKMNSGEYLESENSISTASWLYYSPLYNQKILNLGYTNATDLIVKSDNAYVITRDNEDVDTLIATLERNGYCLSQKVVDIIPSPPGDFLVIQFQEVE